MSFDSLGLSAELLRAVASQNYCTPTPIQARAIPPILQRRDVLARAQTGTGKTAAFMLPILELLASGPREGRRPVRALVLTPTRELALQVHASVSTYGRHLPLEAAAIYGGVSINPQIAQLRRGVDIVVATPGRLLDHVSQGTVELGGVQILVLDEADRMLDMGFIRDIRRVLEQLPRRRQTLLFSATFSKEIRALADGILNNAVRVEVVRENEPVELIDQSVHLVDKAHKRALLSHLIDSGNWLQVLVFTRTKHSANRLAQQLSRDGLSAAAIHGNKSQGARTRALADFKQGNVRVLVATDIAARGLDIDQLPHVVNYELPNVPEDYLHRIGRTGRAGRGGKAVSLVCADEMDSLRGIERLLGASLMGESVAGFEGPPPSRTQNGAGPGGERLRHGQNSRSRAQRHGRRPIHEGNGRGGRPPRRVSGA